VDALTKEAEDLIADAPADGKVGELSVEDSNMANVGTEVDRQRRKEVAQGEPEWKHAGPPLKPGIVIWRVENEKGGKFGVKSWPAVRYGELYLGDSYIVLQTTPGDAVEENPRYKQTFHWKNAAFKSGEHKLDVYYWLGSGSSIDEKGVAAIKTIELDSYLDGKCTHHREVAGNETDEFLALMKANSVKGDINYLEGGKDSGFTEAAVQKRDKHGRPAGFQKASLSTTTIKGKCATLIRTKATGPAAKGKELVEISHGKLASDLLLSKAVYLIDSGFHVFVWIGKDANTDEQDHALIYAEQYLKMRDGGENISSTTIRQGNETPLFCELFSGYDNFEEGLDTCVAFYIRDDLEKYAIGTKRDELEKKGSNSLHESVCDVFGWRPHILHPCIAWCLPARAG
jgi:hypothetical protein